MKVILTQDVARLGHRFSVVEVPNGHAQNYLIPRGLAEPATPDKQRRYAAQREQAEAERTADAEKTAASIAALKEVTVTITAEANEKGNLFKGLHESDVAAAVAAAGHPLNVAAITLAEPIKELGTHTVTIQSGEVSGTLTVAVEAK